MRVESYKTKGGETRFRPIIESRGEMEDAGLCVACGAEASNVEPDAREYECESCGAPKVFGLEELVIMGVAKVEFPGDQD
jgi:hypothetical protein